MLEVIVELVDHCGSWECSSVRFWQLLIIISKFSDFVSDVFFIITVRKYIDGNTVFVIVYICAILFAIIVVLIDIGKLVCCLFFKYASEETVKKFYLLEKTEGRIPE